MLNKLILVGFILLVLIGIFTLLNNQNKNSTPVAFGSGGIYKAQVLGSSASVAGSLSLPALSQRDKLQYQDEAEFKTWSASACSATATAAILNSYGKTVRTTDVLAIMREKKSISTAAGLYDYNVFNVIAERYNLKAQVRQGGDIENHFNVLLDYIKNGTPVLMAVQDSTFFPNGHFISAFQLNADDTISVINPDPLPGRPVLQNWSIAALKTYFGRAPTSVVFFPK
jgi:hypothetical protein